VVQDPLDALYPNMPISVMKTVDIDHSVAIADMGRLLVRLVSEPVEEGGDLVSDLMDTEVRIALEDSGLESGVTKLGEPSIYTCPECHGALLQLKEGNFTRFRCHVGHAYSFNALLTGVTKSVEDSLWNALRAVEESEILMSHMARHLDEAGQNEAAELALKKVQRAKVQAQLVRQAALGNEVTNEETLNDTAKPSHGEV
jgi:two-component system chemotaxis response regulator CheB